MMIKMKSREQPEQIDWEDQEYLREHVHGIAVRVYEELNVTP